MTVGYRETHRPMPEQGDNSFDYKGTCTLASSAYVIRWFGRHAPADTPQRRMANVTEADVVAHATEKRLCVLPVGRDDRDPENEGAANTYDAALVLDDFGVSADVTRYRTGTARDAMSDPDAAQTALRELATHVGERPVIASLNAGLLWDDPHHADGFLRADHTVVVTGAAIEPGSDGVQGFYLNDSATRESGKFINAETMRWAWYVTGGHAVIPEASSLHAGKG
jgi:hypothetical protein